MRDERGTATLMIVGFALVLAMMAAVVTDASAAYLQRQGLDTLADGAAVADYLHRVGAFTRFPGLTASVSVDSSTQRVVVVVRAPVRLPLRVPGSPSHASIGATSSAEVVRVVTSHTPATFCIQVPMLDTTEAIQMARNSE